MRTFSILILLVASITGCTTQLKPKSEWLKEADCNVKVDSLDRARLCTRVEPKYPRKAALKGLTGIVRVSFDVNAQGKPRNLKVEEAYPERIFDDAATDAVRLWRFIPKFENGIAVEDTGLSFSLRFSLGQEAHISKDDWLQNLLSILETKMCGKLKLKSAQSCRDELINAFTSCVKAEKTLEQVTLIDDLNFASKLGNKITTCVFQTASQEPKGIQS